jgi:hypothetical protein
MSRVRDHGRVAPCYGVSSVLGRGGGHGSSEVKTVSAIKADPRTQNSINEFLVQEDVGVFEWKRS